MALDPSIDPSRLRLQHGFLHAKSRCALQLGPESPLSHQYRAHGASGGCMATPLKIDFVSDVSCPWCVIGLKSLESALKSLQGEVAAELHFQPFELDPQMGAAGQDIAEHIAQKYGSSPAEIERNRENIRSRGAQVGFDFNMQKRARIYNTFDAHRLLHWSQAE